MNRSEVEKQTGLTRKAIEYYEKKGLIEPIKMENGYRVYSIKDVEDLKEIQVYRSLGLSIEEILAIKKDESSRTSILRKKQIKTNILSKKSELINELIDGENMDIVAKELRNIERQESLYSRLEKAFPGYFAQCFFFSYKPYFTEAVSEDGEEAFKEFISYMDGLPTLELSAEEQSYIEAFTSNVSNETMEAVNNKKNEAVNDVEKWYSENKSVLDMYYAYKNSEEYTNSPLMTIEEKLNKYMIDNKYYEIAIPLIRKFSKSYDEYYKKLLEAEEKFKALKNTPN